MKECTELKAKELVSVCPYCEEENEGWVVDPRNKTDKCSSCGKEYKIHQDADIEYY